MNRKELHQQYVKLGVSIVEDPSAEAGVVSDLLDALLVDYAKDVSKLPTKEATGKEQNLISITNLSSRLVRDIADILGYHDRKITTTQKLIETLFPTQEDIAQNFAIPKPDIHGSVEHMNTIILPPDQREVITGSGTGRESSEIVGYDKIGLIEGRIARELEMERKDIQRKTGEIRSNQMRRVSYYFTHIPQRDVTIITNNQYGEGTFVTQGERLHHTETKKTNKGGPDFVLIRFNYEDPSEFLGRLFDKIKTNNTGNIVERNNIKSEYYKNKDCIYYDLSSFALAAGREVDDISSGGQSIEFKTHDNRIIKWNTYLLDAGFYLGYGPTKKIVSTQKKTIVAQLKKTAGIIKQVMDVDYYSKDNIILDLTSIAKARQKAPQELTTYDFSGYFVANNGEKISCKKYLFGAGQALGLVQNYEEFQHHYQSVLMKLKQILGWEIVTHKEMNRDYFVNKKNLKHDFEKILQTMGKKRVFDISTACRGYIQCANGENIAFSTYLKRFGKTIQGIDTTRNSQEHIGLILVTLKDLYSSVVLGFKARDYGYYTNQESVFCDLSSAANKLNKSVHRISENDNVDFIASNNQKVAFKDYLKHAKYVFNDVGMSLKNKNKTLEKLKEIANIDHEITDSYSRENLEHDLNNFLLAIGKSHIQELNTNDTGSAQCSSGEVMSWSTYLKRASQALGFKQEEALNLGETLLYLKKQLIPNMQGFHKRDDQYYFNKENILYDLKCIAREQGKSWKDLTTGGELTTFVPKVGNEITRKSYLRDAGKKIFALKNTRDPSYSAKKTLSTLKDLILS